MTEELKQKAENFIINRYKLNECYREDNEETREYMRMDVHSQYEEEYQSYLAGATENGIQWHDLRKDPNDLPKDNKNVYVQYADGNVGFDSWYDNSRWFNNDPSPIIAWCEITTFKEL